MRSRQWLNNNYEMITIDGKRLIDTFLPPWSSGFHALSIDAKVRVYLNSGFDLFERNEMPFLFFDYFNSTSEDCICSFQVVKPV